MISRRWLQVFAPIFLSLLPFTTAYASSKPSPYSQVQKEVNVAASDLSSTVQAQLI